MNPSDKKLEKILNPKRLKVLHVNVDLLSRSRDYEIPMFTYDEMFASLFDKFGAKLELTREETNDDEVVYRQRGEEVSQDEAYQMLTEQVLREMGGMEPKPSSA